MMSFSMKRGKRWSCALLLVLAAQAVCHAKRAVTDELGRLVLVPDHPHRIICLVPSITDDVFALDAGNDVVAVSDYVEYPAAAKLKPSIGSLTDPSIERILAFHPDLILGMPHLNQQATFEQFERLGIPVFMVDPHGLQGLLHSITTLGEAIHRKDEAVSLALRLQKRIDAVRFASQSQAAISVFMPIWYDPVITIGKGSFITEVVEAAGGRSVTDDLPEEWPTINMETVLARAPQSLLLDKSGGVTITLLADKPGWKTLPAVVNRRAYYVDKRIELPSPVAIDALEDLARQFHP